MRKKPGDKKCDCCHNRIKNKHVLIERHVRASSQMNKTRANMRHFLTCIKFFHQFEKKSSNSNLPLFIFRMSIIADFLNPYYTHRGNDKRWQK
ncbi:hypothetical protein D2184_24915 [Escherichia coli]|nr:hypothetical protein SSJG_01131 [Escherichia coli D9]RJF23038.1 hypothetical protein D2184_24915 [Escherichia coli]TXX29944.1 hypothetical protein D4M43_22325 [Escherichia coli]CCJ43946.1 putative uncharacterized protein [Escherichia coli]CCK46651.1 putative uncharacterized protein [Escherichia coli chi7122]